MHDISKIDKNFVVKTKIEKDDINFYTVDEAPFKVYGVFREKDRYRRLPETVAKTVNEGVYGLHANTAGGRVRFITDSPYIAIHAEMDNVGKMPHFPLTGSAGFDLYVDNVYTKTFVPPFNIENGYESVCEFKSKEIREITINFPLYSDVKELYIGLQDGAMHKEAQSYKNIKPIVYYGSSITQGGCASTPGMSYQSIISRELNYDYINLGFSGCALAEDEIADYIKNLDMSIFVYDYDYNAPNVEHLMMTHEKMFKTIREKNPLLPIIMMCHPKYNLTEVDKQRQEVIETTFKNAVSSGDENVYFIDGKTLMKLCKNSGTVDTVHPTDYGFASMAESLVDVIKKIEI